MPSVFLIGMAGFTIASAACGLATDPAVLIGSRFAQGAMGALMVAADSGRHSDDVPERRARQGDCGLQRGRPFAIGLGTWLLFWIAMGGFFLVWTLFMQGGLGWSPLRAGLTSALFAVGAGVGAGLSVGVLAVRYGRRVLIAGALVN
ncbi:hypothetical protein AB0F44_30280, partial [Nocardioides sp. NPDC023903]